MSISRRGFLKSSAASAVLGTLGLPSIALAKDKTVTIGLNIPMTGDYAPWGLPGLYGCQIIADNINNSGGARIGTDNYQIRVIGYDHGYDTEKALQGFKQLTYDDKAALVMMLGGSTVASVMPFANRRRVLTSTLLPSDITTETPYLVAPCETHPLYNVTGVEWLAKNHPDAKTAVIVTTNDIEYGKQSAATYQAAFEAAGIQVLDTVFHGFDVVDFAPVVSGLLANKADIFCMATDVYTTPIMEQLYHQNYQGKIISCTLDGYQDVISKTSKDFVEGVIFQFPDFDDPKLNAAQVNFPDPAGFFATFEKRHPGQWSAVAWEYPSILLTWIDAAKQAKSINSTDVLNSLLADKTPTHTFGNAKWWGSTLWGRDQASVGDWPVVVIRNGKARIQAFISVYDWVNKHQALLSRKMKALSLNVV